MKIAVVTGASSGIGREFVRQIPFFYRELDEIWVIARREDRLKQLEQTSRTPWSASLPETCRRTRFIKNTAGL